MSRSILGNIFKNFLNSIRPRQISGTLVGEDYMKNKYYEIPADPRGGKRTPTRWFVPDEKDNFQQELPSEWEAWLRGRRKEVPKTDEILKNLGIMQMKKVNAVKVAQENPFVHAEEQEISHQPTSQFPKLDEFELPKSRLKK